MSSLGRPCAVQVALVSLDHVLDQGEHEEPEYDRGDRKDHVFNRPLTILVAEHDISLMARYCDLCIIMKKGELVAIGNPKEVITEDLIREVYEVEATVGFDREGEIYVLPKHYAPKNDVFQDS